jgi:hypothetical protein
MRLNVAGSDYCQAKGISQPSDRHRNHDMYLLQGMDNILNPRKRRVLELHSLPSRHNRWLTHLQAAPAG